ncbi:hypothetical protein B0H19DRAFT_1235904 [Mycena capillaripes]|nr:hypothetical protein B0H19DRAFT_1235904 [Mycena capillaripes]
MPRLMKRRRDELADGTRLLKKRSQVMQVPDRREVGNPIVKPESHISRSNAHLAASAIQVVDGIWARKGQPRDDQPAVHATQKKMVNPQRWASKVLEKEVESKRKTEIQAQRRVHGSEIYLGRQPGKQGEEQPMLERNKGGADLIRFDAFGKHPQSRSRFFVVSGFGTPKTFDSVPTLCSSSALNAHSHSGSSHIFLPASTARTLDDLSTLAEFWSGVFVATISPGLEAILGAFSSRQITPPSPTSANSHNPTAEAHSSSPLPLLLALSGRTLLHPTLTPTLVVRYYAHPILLLYGFGFGAHKRADGRYAQRLQIALRMTIADPRSRVILAYLRARAVAMGSESQFACGLQPVAVHTFSALQGVRKAAAEGRMPVRRLVHNATFASLFRRTPPQGGRGSLDIVFGQDARYCVRSGCEVSLLFLISFLEGSRWSKSASTSSDGIALYSRCVVRERGYFSALGNQSYALQHYFLALFGGSAGCGM